MTEFKNPASTVDLIVRKQEKILLIKRGEEPFKGMWALPGGHIEYGLETLEEAGVRELLEETNLRTSIQDLRLSGVYSNPDRDPRGHVISHAYSVENYEGTPKPGDDAAELAFFPLNALPELAFDHKQIIEDYTAKGYYTRKIQ